MEQTNLQKYQEMQAMVQKEIQTLFPSLFKEQIQAQYNINKIPNHEHNGTDSVRIPAVNLLNNVKYNYGINVVPLGAAETFYMRAIPNMQSLTLFGFAANNYPPPTAATQRAIINGHAAFGKCFEFGEPGAEVTPNINLIGLPITQGSNAMFVDSTDLTKNRVAFSTDDIINVVDGSGATIITVHIDSYLNNVIQLTVSALPSDWQIFFSIIMS